MVFLSRRQQPEARKGRNGVVGHRRAPRAPTRRWSLGTEGDAANAPPPRAPSHHTQAHTTHTHTHTHTHTSTNTNAHAQTTHTPRSDRCDACCHCHPRERAFIVLADEPAVGAVPAVPCWASIAAPSLSPTVGEAVPVTALQAPPLTLPLVPPPTSAASLPTPAGATAAAAAAFASAASRAAAVV